MDSSTQGNWIGTYGQDGYVIVAAATNLPSYVQITTDNLFEQILDPQSVDPKALLRPDGASRILSTWYGPYAQTFSFILRFSDQIVHRLAIYFLDQPDELKYGHIELSDTLTGQILASQPLSDNGLGGYLIFDIAGNIQVKVISSSITYATVPGCFFATPTVDKPVMTPAGGTFAGKTLVNISSTPGATIHFTTDGTTPDENSLVYQGPLEIRSSVVVKAKAFKEGYIAASEVTSAAFTNLFKTEVEFISVDSVTQGNWPGQYGQEAFWVMNGDSRTTPFVEFTPGPHDSYLWSDSTTEPRAIRRSPNDSVRIGACWNSPDQMVIDLSVYDTYSRPLALYFMDWDHGGRVEDVTISDAGGMVLDQRRVDEFDGGKYLVWKAKGGVRITIKRVGGNNTILNGVFIGPEVIPLISSSPATLASAKMTAEGYHMQIIGEPGQTFTVETSSDLTHWTPLQTQTLTGTTWDFIDPLSKGQSTRIYRARLDP